MNNQDIRTKLNQILARNADRPEHTVDDIIELFRVKNEDDICDCCLLNKKSYMNICEYCADKLHS